MPVCSQNFCSQFWCPLNPPPPQTAKWWIPSSISIKRPSNRIANTPPKLRTQTLRKLRTDRIKAKSGNLSLFLRILPFFPWLSLCFARKKGKRRRKRFRLPDFALLMNKRTFLNFMPYMNRFVLRVEVVFNLLTEVPCVFAASMSG